MVFGGVTEASGLDVGHGRRALSSAERASYPRVTRPDPESRDQGCEIVVEDTRDNAEDTRAGSPGNVQAKSSTSRGERQDGRIHTDPRVIMSGFLHFVTARVGCHGATGEASP